MSTTVQARSLFPTDRRTAAKWVLARRYLARRNLAPYKGMPMAARIVQPRAQ
jgi:hypothetical protein